MPSCLLAASIEKPPPSLLSGDLDKHLNGGSLSTERPASSVETELANPVKRYGAMISENSVSVFTLVLLYIPPLCNGRIKVDILHLCLPTPRAIEPTYFSLPIVKRLER